MLTRAPGDNQSDIQTKAKPAVIELRDVSVEFDAHQVLKNVNLDIKDGEFVALIGPSGGGKSTLLRIIAGLLNHYSGSVRVDCKPAVVFQDYRLLPWRTVLENVRLPRDLSGNGESAEAVLKQVGMLEHADRYPHQLSGGMQARVAIARALAQDADILLLDEPFAALDALVRERFNLEMKRLHEKTGKTFIFVTHSIREAVYLGDKVVVLKDGHVDEVLDAHNEGRITAYSDGIEASLRAKLGMATSTYIKPKRTRRRFPWEALGVLALAIFFLSLWQLFASRAELYYLPPPSAIWDAALNTMSLLTRHTLATLRVTGLGLTIALLLGVPTGYFMGKSLAGERLLSPFIVALQAVPTIIIAPLLTAWLGFGLAPRLVVTTLISIFPIIISTMVGVREVGKRYREVFETIGAKPWAVFTQLEFPGALPVVLGGLRLAVSLALIGAVVSEFVFLGSGLGFFTNAERLNFRYANAYAGVGVTVLLGLCLYLGVTLLERSVLRYRKA